MIYHIRLKRLIDSGRAIICEEKLYSSIQKYVNNNEKLRYPLLCAHTASWGCVQTFFRRKGNLKKSVSSRRFSTNNDDSESFSILELTDLELDKLNNETQGLLTVPVSKKIKRRVSFGFQSK
eukprot:TRINITY_DN4239_c0_g4_i1.p1 TRINITY_DN4239_c0_g4~~TRINITY_DN4239_c0_g4_i1.p1  ORF type:complete len:122 (+),score=13.46 TRINITY_DN4239_c0_g4_i1:422-787(+)